MVTGWRRAFCTTIPKEKAESLTVTEKQQEGSKISSSSPRISSRLGFFSNPSTPRFRHQQQDPDPAGPTPALRCRTTAATKSSQTPTSSAQNSPRSQSNNKRRSIAFNSPRLLFHYFSSSNSNASNPSSPRSPSALSLIKSTLRLSRNRCGICAQGVKNGEGTAIFTAECNHEFHVSCLKSQVVVASCPVCGCAWREPPPLSSERKPEDQNKKHLRVYDDDEPLMSSSPGSLFVPIPEYDERLQEDDDDVEGEFQGFIVNTPTPPPLLVRPRINTKAPEVSIHPESALVSVGRSHETRVAVLKVRAPQYASSARAMRPPADLVALLDVSEGGRPRGLKRAVAVIVSSLGPTDRFSVVAFSSASKRLLPLRRMTPAGRRSTRRVVDAIVFTGRRMAVGDALKKAAKVIEDRRERNPLAGIIVISSAGNHSSTAVSTTRFSPQSDLHIPVHSVSLGEGDPDALSKCVGGMLAVMFQEVSLQLRFAPGSAPAEVSAVYPLTGRTRVFGHGSIRVGDLYGGEEREFLVEVKVPASHAGAYHVLSVRPSFRDPARQETVSSKEHLVLVPRPTAARSTAPVIQRLRNVHVTTRAIAESRRVLELAGDVSGAGHLLSSARALVMQSADGSAGECLRSLEAELAELQWRNRVSVRGLEQRNALQQVAADEKGDPLTPTSAWRAAERLAKVAITRKHMNKVSDLHGFENARF